MKRLSGSDLRAFVLWAVLFAAIIEILVGSGLAVVATQATPTPSVLKDQTASPTSTIPYPILPTIPVPTPPVFGPWAQFLDGKVEGPYLFTVTAYNDHDGHTPGSVSYSGLPVREGLTFACGPELKIGDMIILENGMRGVCLDRGGAITRGRLDVYLAELEEAKAFGVQEIRGVVVR